MARILVTGGSGFIATHLKNHTTRHDLFFLTRTPKSECDILVEELATGWSIETISEFDAVIHLAGHIPEPEQLDDFKNCSVGNVGFTNFILETARNIKARKFVYVSSFAVYEGLIDQPIEDTTVPLPMTRYSQSKLAAEYLLMSYANSFEGGCHILRPAFTYGSNMKEARLIPFVIRSLHSQTELEVFRPNQLIDLSYVSDVCDSFLNAVDTQIDGVKTINLVNESISKRDLVLTIWEAMNSKCKLNFVGDQGACCRSVDDRNYASLLGYTPQKIKTTILDMI